MSDLFDSAVSRMAALLKKRRLERRISQRQLADSAGVNQSVVSRAERGGDALLSTWDALFQGLGDRLELDSTEFSEEAGDLLDEEAERRRENRDRGLSARHW
jgi:transcriptional regulator with XRE-family HTH domain